MNIEIPKEIAERLQKRVDESDGEFKTVEDYVKYILEQVVERLANEGPAEEKKEEQTFSEEDEEKVKERLRALGYLD